MLYKKIHLDKLMTLDIETGVNLFLVCVKEYKTGSKKEFIIFDNPKYNGQAFELFKFLNNCVKQQFTAISYNGAGFDLQILDYFYNACLPPKNAYEEVDILYEFDNQYIIDTIYAHVQEIIGGQTEYMSNKFNEALKPEYKLFLPTIDLYKQQHFDRKGCSLKWLEFSMQLPKIQEMPFKHDDEITIDDLQEVIEYCWHDVEATEMFFNKIKHETETRLTLSKEYNLDLYNATEPKMVREIFGKFLCEEMQISYPELKKLKTIRGKIHLKDIILPYVNFQTQQFKDVLQVFNNTTIDCSPNSEDKFKHSFNFNGLKVDLGMGGIHSCIQSGVYEPLEDELIEDSDGTSYYPFLAIRNNFHPEHLGDAFNKIYPKMYEERIKYDKKDPRNYIFKIILNSCFGLSNEINGYLYDPKLMLQITINGQLSLLMLVEALNISVPNIQFLQFNTDGITYKYNKQYENIVRKICNWWQKVTQINLEHAYYSKMVILDVNNYLAKDVKGNIKRKGCFEYDMPLFKNTSGLIIPKALEQYFINNLTPTQFINNKNNSIFDYCFGVKKKSNFKINLIQNFNYAELITEQQKVCRYFISKPTNETGLLVKDFDNGKRVSVEANIQVQPLDIINYKTCENYTIDYAYYIKEAQKIIEQIVPTVIQKTLF